MFTRKYSRRAGTGVAHRGIPLPTMSYRCRLRHLFVCLFFAAFSPAQTMAADCLKLISQNALHMNTNDPGPRLAKDRHLTTMFASKAFAPPNTNTNMIGLIQEQMRSYDNTYTPFGTYPAPRAPYLQSPLKGHSSYLEKYGFLLDPNIAPGQYRAIVEYETINAGHAANFSRPPSALLYFCRGPANPATNVWIVNYHAVFGKRKWQRRNEAKAMKQVVIDFMNCGYNLSSGNCAAIGSANTVSAKRVVVAGDWNLTAAEVLADVNANAWPANYEVAVFQEDKTSMRRSSGLWSSSYDHFLLVRVGTPTAGLNNVSRISFADYGAAFNRCNNANGCAAFRQSVSDHIGIIATVPE